MALVVKDRVKETTATTGTGTLTLAGAVTGFQSFSSALSDGDTTYYAIFEGSTGEWEVGLGTFTSSGTTLARTTVLASSNSGSAVNLTAGAAEVFITQPATKAAYFDGSGNLVLNQDPTSALQAATKQYVDTIAAAGLHYHDPVRVEQEGNLNATYDNGTSGVGATLTNAGTQAALVIDGVTMVVNDRVLIYEQTNAAHNGIYTVTNVGSASTNWVLTRATDADSYGPSDPDALGQGDAFFVQEGAAGAGETYVMNTEGTITFGTTDITFAQISSAQIYSAGDGLTLTGTTFAAGAGTGVTVNANDIAIGQDVGTTANVTFNTVTADLTGDVTGNVTGSSGSTTGNAATATALQTGRTISLTGDVTGTSAAFDGTGNVSISTTIGANSVALGTDTTGNYVSTGAVSGNGLSGSASAEGATFTVSSNATNANTASTIVFRDASGNFSAGTITAALTGNVNGNATTASAWQTGRTLSLTGDVTGSTSIDGSGNASISTTISANSVALGTDTTGNYVAGATQGTGVTISGTPGEGWSPTISIGQAVGTGNSPSFAGLNINGNLNAVDNVYLASAVYHEGDTNTYLSFTTDTVYLASGGTDRVIVNNTGVRLGDTGNGYFQPVSGNYGSIQIDGGAHGGWEGYSIGGRVVFMHDNSTGSGLYNDASNEWMVYCVLDGEVRLYYNGSSKLQTTSSGVNIDGDLNAVTSIVLDDGIYSEGDTNTYIQFHAADQFRVVTGGVERLEVNNTRTQIDTLFTDAAIGEDYDPLSGTSVTADPDNGGAFSLTMTGNTTFTFGAPALGSGVSTGFIIELTGNGSTVTWPASVDWAGGTAPDAPASGETDIYVFWTRDGGTTWYGVQSIDAAA